MKKEDLGVLKISMSYFLLGTIWVFFSDKILFKSLKFSEGYLNYSIIKGIVFIVFSSVFIFVLVKREINKRIKIWEYYATHDAMTKCLNRKAGLEKLNTLLKNYSLRSPISIIYVDLNNLKMINDNYGHSEGDKAIIRISKIFKQSVKKDDFVVRLGGDEFLIVLLNSDEKNAEKIIEVINEKINVLNLSSRVELSISCGVATYTQEYINIEDFINEADRRMYENKKLFHSQLKFA
ncbi:MULTISPECIES: GGDEF domain-containing protein [Caloramator]|uniref:Diguanylate cyclase (GGDEF) domain-containing protein n=1 Tax=Caloramator proteoclasticus DSM 10124 TaxID=1121262 RepID=A0A1M4XC32_9CLOT|nr:MULTISPECIES: diguanylate cyclase [Caloramator]SHE91099.1 diguanylate cyclase (GGDEF) domain-containing protein [Caloramator proteoclasticus DSM 10124]